MGYYYNYAPELNYWRFRSPKIKKKMTAAIVADLHECSFGDRNCRLFDTLDEAAPDMVIIAGDLIQAEDGKSCNRTMGVLKKLTRRYPVLYGVGNHEHKVYDSPVYWKKRKSLDQGLRRAGISLMRNVSVDIPDTGIRITGLDLNRPYYRKVIRRPLPKGLLKELLGERDPALYNVLIAHNPEHFKDYLRWKPDLILSGHVHGGIIRLPYLGGVVSPAYRLFPRYDAGLFREKGTCMLISRGVGTHSLNIRLWNRPEIPVICLEPGTKAEAVRIDVP